jgi:hypothetical protein
VIYYPLIVKLRVAVVTVIAELVADSKSIPDVVLEHVVFPVTIILVTEIVVLYKYVAINPSVGDPLNVMLM